jgi:hypothetical protein
MIAASSMLVLGRRFTLVERSHTLVFRGRASECLVSRGIVGFPSWSLFKKRFLVACVFLLAIFHNTIRLQNSRTYLTSTGAQLFCISVACEHWA